MMVVQVFVMMSSRNIKKGFNFKISKVMKLTLETKFDYLLLSITFIEHINLIFYI